MKPIGLIILALMMLGVLAPLAQATTYQYFGNKNGAANDGFFTDSGANYMVALDITTGAIETTSVNLYFKIWDPTTGSHYKGLIWNSSTGALLATSSTIYTTIGGSTYHWANVSISYTLRPSTSYKVGYITDHYCCPLATDNATTQSHRDTVGNNYAAPGAFSATTNYSWRFLMYVEYSTYLGPFYGSAGTGPIYFTTDFTYTSLTYSSGRVNFHDFNLANAGNFTDIGFSAATGLTVTVLEVIPNDHLLIKAVTSSSGNFTLYLPNNYVKSVSGSVAWHWDNSTKLVKITAPTGITQITITFNSGNYPTIFYIPQWFVDQGGSFFGVTGFFSQVTQVMAAFVTWFVLSVSTVKDLIFSIATMIFFVAGSVIYWFSLFVSFWVSLFTLIGAIVNGSSALSGYTAIVWAELNMGSWVQFIPIVLTLAWFDSITRRSKSSGKNDLELMVSDIQIILYVVGVVWDWSWTIFNFTYSTILSFVTLIWSMVP